MDILKIIKWLCVNIKLQKRHEEIFKKYIEENEEFCLIEQNIENKHIYDFLIYIIMKNLHEEISNIHIKHSTVTNEYKKFKIEAGCNINQSFESICNVIDKIPGIRHFRKTVKDDTGMRIRYMDIDLSLTIQWLNENIPIPDKYKTKFSKWI